MKPIMRMVDRIPHPGARRAVMLALVLAVSLGLGFTIEKTTSAATLTALHDAQDGWIDTIGAMTPMGLAEGYLGDIDAALKGKWLYEPPPNPVERSPAAIEIASRFEACAAARAARSLQPTCIEQYGVSGMSASECMVKGSEPGCAALLDCLARTRIVPLEPPECANLPRFQLAPLTPSTEGVNLDSGSNRTHPVLIPLASIVHGATRITHGGLGAILMAAFQLAIGFVVFIVITRAVRTSHEPGFGDGWMNYILGPISVIALGSGVALALQWLMLGTLALFSWLTGLAAGAAGATGIIGGLWWAASKLTEKGIEDALTKRD